MAARAQPRVLFVDDEPAILEFAKMALSRVECELETAADGAEGWRALQARHFDLLVTDHHMPEMTGLELVRRVRQAGSVIPIIMVSGMMPADAQRGAPDLRLSATLPKPFTAMQISALVQRTLAAWTEYRQRHSAAA
jgi:CheY-like chemotaxis protein